MKKAILGALSCLAVFLGALDAAAQNNHIQVGGITRVNLGDGRWLHRELESEAPLEGQHRIIDGVRSEYIEAEFTGGLYDGSYEQYKYNKLAEKGTYIEGRKHGLFTKHTSNGNLDTETPYVDGKVNGVVKSYYTDGTLKTEKGYENGMEHGPDRKFTFGETEPSHDWNFVENLKDGRQYTHVKSNQGDYHKVEHYKKGVKAGEYLETWPDGSIKVKGAYENGKEIGLWVAFTRQGKQEVYRTFRDGLMHGLSKSFFDDGTVSSTSEWVEGKREGVTRNFRYSDGGLASEYRYSNGALNGEYAVYFDNGELKHTGVYEEDIIIQQTFYHDNGQISEVIRRNERGQMKTVEMYERDGTVVPVG